jgi:Na+/H+ antiporter NhaB
VCVCCLCVCVLVCVCLSVYVCVTCFSGEHACVFEYVCELMFAILFCVPYSVVNIFNQPSLLKYVIIHVMVYQNHSRRMTLE